MRQAVSLGAAVAWQPVESGEPCLDPGGGFVQVMAQSARRLAQQGEQFVLVRLQNFEQLGRRLSLRTQPQQIAVGENLHASRFGLFKDIQGAHNARPHTSAAPSAKLDGEASSETSSSSETLTFKVFFGRKPIFACVRASSEVPALPFMP